MTRRGITIVREVLAKASQVAGKVTSHPHVQRAKEATVKAARGVQELLKPEEPKVYSRRQSLERQGVTPEEAAAAAASRTSTGTALMEVAHPESSWKHWSQKFEKSTIYSHVKLAHSKLEKTKLYQSSMKAKEKVHDKVEELRDTYETSQNPLVWRVREVGDSIMAESDTSLAMGELKRMDPKFSVPELMDELENYMIPKVVTAWLQGDLDILNKVCEDNAKKAVLGEINRRMTLGWKLDDRILDVSHIDFHDATILDGQEPVVIVTFVCQHVNCARDLSGQIVDGSESKIQHVHYTWVMKKEHECLDFNWKIVDMSVQGITALI